MSKAMRPWMKWYPADWRSDPGLRMCSFAARGLWADMLALMHEAEPYGHLLVNGRQPTPPQLASLVGGSPREIERLLNELSEAGVFSETDEHTIYSRRMVRDIQRAETDKANGNLGGNPSLKEGVNPPDKAHMPEARGQTSPYGEGPLPAPAKPSRRKAKTPYPDGWVPSIAVGLREGLTEEDCRREIDKHRAWCAANDARYADWQQAADNWFRRAAEYGQQGSASQRAGANGQEAGGVVGAVSQVLAVLAKRESQAGDGWRGADARPDDSPIPPGDEAGMAGGGVEILPPRHVAGAR